MVCVHSTVDRVDSIVVAWQAAVPVGWGTDESATHEWCDLSLSPWLVELDEQLDKSA